MPFFKSSDGVRLHYEMEGSGPPLVLHLGAGADIELWRRAGYVEPLARSYTCVLFDHRGHGPSDHPKSLEANHIDRYADDVVALIKHLGHPQVTFFGWSNAVLVALKTAHKHPGMFDALILFGAIGGREMQAEIEARLAKRLPILRERGWLAILDRMQAAENFPVPQWFLDSVLETDPEPWIAFTASQAAWNWSPWDAMPAVAVPTLIFAGELEDPDDVMADVAATMRHATRIRVPEREHINAFLYSEFVLPRVLEFLAERPSQATG